MLAVAGPEMPMIEAAPPLLEAPPAETETPPEEFPAKITETADESPASTAADRQIEDEAPAATQPEVPPAPTEPTKLVSAETDSTTRAVEPTQQEPRPAAVESVATTDPIAAAAAPTLVASQLPTAPQATSPYSLRNTEGRLGLVEQQGGSGRTESAGCRD